MKQGDTVGRPTKGRELRGVGQAKAQAAQVAPATGWCELDPGFCLATPDAAAIDPRFSTRCGDPARIDPGFLIPPPDRPGR